MNNIEIGDYIVNTAKDYDSSKWATRIGKIVGKYPISEKYEFQVVQYYKHPSTSGDRFPITSDEIKKSFIVIKDSEWLDILYG